MKDTINDRVNNLFKTLNLDIQEVANNIAKNPVTISRILEKTHTPTKSTVKAIADATNASFDYLMFGKGEMLLSNKNVNNVENPWKDEAYSQLKKDMDYLKEQYSKVLNRLLDGGQNLGKSKALNNLAGLQESNQLRVRVN